MVLTIKSLYITVHLYKCYIKVHSFLRFVKEITVKKNNNILFLFYKNMCMDPFYDPSIP